MTPADVAKNVAPKPQARKKPVKKSSPSGKLPPPRKPADDTPSKPPTTKASASIRR